MMNRLAFQRLRLESLESRDVPATCTWDYYGNNEGASGSSDWWVDGNVPGATDDIVIPAGTGNMALEQTRVRSITTPANWGKYIYVGAATTIGGADEFDYSFSYMSGTLIKAPSNLSFVYGEICLDDSDITREGASSTVTFYGNTYVTGGLEFAPYMINNGVMNVNSAIQVTWSGSTFVNNGTVELTGTYTWNPYNSVNTNNIFTNNLSGTLLKEGTGTYTFGSYIHNEGKLKLMQGDLYLKGKATANFGDVSIHSYDTAAKIYLSGDTDLSADYTIWVDTSMLLTRPGNDSYVTSISGANLRLDGAMLDIGFTDTTGLNVLVVQYNVQVLNSSAIYLNFDGFMGFCDHLICDTLTLGYCAIEVTATYTVSEFTDFKIIDCDAVSGDFDAWNFGAHLTAAWNGADYEVHYVP